MAIVEDLSVLLNTDHFATAATVGAATVNGIFDESFVEINGVESLSPTFYCASADVTANSMADGTAITIGGTGYTVRGVQPDGSGMTLLILELA